MSSYIQLFKTAVIAIALGTIGSIAPMEEREKREPSPFERFFAQFYQGEEVPAKKDPTVREEATLAAWAKTFLQRMAAGQEPLDLDEVADLFIQLIDANQRTMVDYLLQNFSNFLKPETLKQALAKADIRNDFDLMRLILQYIKLDLFEIVRDYPNLANYLLTQFYYGETSYSPEDVEAAFLQTIITDNREHLGHLIIDHLSNSLKQESLLDALVEAFLNKRFNLARHILKSADLSRKDRVTIFKRVLEDISRYDFTEIYEVLEEEMVDLIQQEDFENGIRAALQLAILRGNEQAVNFLLDIAARRRIHIDRSNLEDMVQPYVNIFLTLRGRRAERPFTFEVPQEGRSMGAPDIFSYLS